MALLPVASKTIEFPHVCLSHDPHWLLTHAQLAVFYFKLPAFRRVS